ncbi:hypothetical protein LZ554_001665 [Drepanopeziza brunnea f. sp. 'monogermtubi']|nr:hypothetical protein LZ554_001665 [Drepanopeziza brunnea f. sp. 'monogermtubi']
MVSSRKLWAVIGLLGIANAQVQFPDTTSTTAPTDGALAKAKPKPTTSMRIDEPSPSRSGECQASTVTVPAPCYPMDCYPTTITKTKTRYVTLPGSTPVSISTSVSTKTVYVSTTEKQYSTEEETEKYTETSVTATTSTDPTTATTTALASTTQFIYSSYPYNVTIMNSYGYPVVTTEWSTSTATVVSSYVKAIPNTVEIIVPTTTTLVSTEFQPSELEGLDIYRPYARLAAVTVISTYTYLTSYPASVISSATSYVYVPITEISTYTASVTDTEILSSAASFPTTTTETSISVSLSVSTYEITSTYIVSYPVTVISSTTIYSYNTATTTTTQLSLATDTSYVTDSTTTTTTSVSTLFLTTTSTLPASTVTTSISGSLTTITLPASTTVTTVISLITSFITFPGEVTTLPGQITTLLASTITLPGQTTTISGQITTLPASVITLPGQITTLPGALTSFTAPGEITKLPGQITTLSGSVSTQKLPGLATTLDGTVSTIPGQYININIPGAISVSISRLPGQATTLPGQNLTLPATSLSTIPGIVSTIAGPYGPTITLPPVLNTILIPGSTIINPGSAVAASSLVICPKPTNLPGVAVTPQDTGPRALWGCSPGYVCNVPKPAGCDIFADPPDYDYLCDAKYCIPSPLFPVVTWPEGETAYYPLTEGYFNLNPQAFGLDFTVFVTNVVVITVAGKYGKLETITEAGQHSSQVSLSRFESTSTPTFTVGLKSSAYTPITSAHARWKKSREEHVQAREAWVQARDTLHLLKRDASVAPAVCFAQCNNCYIEAQSVGKSPALCAADSAFRSYYEGCQSCVASNSDTSEESLAVYVEPKFAEFTDYCDAQAPAIPVLDDSLTSTVPVTQMETPLPVTWHGFYPNLFLHASSCITKPSIKWPRDIAQHDTKQPATNDLRT